MFRLYLIFGLIASVGMGLFIWHYKATIEENKRLTKEINAANLTIKQLDAKVEAEAAITRNSDEILEVIRNAPETDDAPVAPVLDAVIDRL